MLTILSLIYDYLDYPFELQKVNKSVYKRNYKLSLRYSSRHEVVNNDGAIAYKFKLPNEKVLGKYKFTYINFNWVVLTDKLLQSLCGTKYLICGPEVFIQADFGESLKHLSGIHILSIYIPEKYLGINQFKDINWLSDIHISYLSGIKILCLENGCELLTDEALKYLSGIEVLNIRNNKNITDNGLKYLSGIKRLMTRSRHITDIGLEYISPTIEYLVLGNTHISHTGIAFMKCIKWMSVFDEYIGRFVVENSIVNDYLNVSMTDDQELIYDYICGLDYKFNPRKDELYQNQIKRMFTI